MTDHTIEEVIQDPALLKGKARSIQMFKDWFYGMPMVAIASKYDITVQRVSKIKQRDKWAKYAEDIRERQYAALSNEWKHFAAKLTVGLKKDYDRLFKKILDSETAQFTDSERTHIRHMMAFLTKQVSLADNKPTEIQENIGTVTHRVILPPQAKRWGVIPPGPNVEHVSQQDEDDQNKSKIDLDDLDDLGD